MTCSNIRTYARSGRRDHPTLPPLQALVVEDDEVTRDIVVSTLVGESFRVFTAGTIAHALSLLDDNEIVLITIDVELPDGCGFDLAQMVRQSSNAGVIFLTVRASEVDRILGLELGGDDYLTKPVRVRELAVRARNLVRRVVATTDPVLQSPSDATRFRIFAFRGWRFIAPKRHLIDPTGCQQTLSRTEARILETLIERRGAVVSREALLASLDAPGSLANQRSVDLSIMRLRRKLGENGRRPEFLINVRGEGYLFGEPADVSPDLRPTLDPPGAECR